MGIGYGYSWLGLLVKLKSVNLDYKVKNSDV